MSDINEYYQGKTAIVTGAACGVGFGLAEGVLKYGAKSVVLFDINDEKLKEAVAKLNAQYPGRAFGLICDVTKEDQVRAKVDEAVAILGGRLDFMFNNAGKFYTGLTYVTEKNKGALKMGKLLTEEDWQKGFQLNFYAALYGIWAALPIMYKQGGGHIVNTISGIAFCPMPFSPIYDVTKSALNALTLALRAEFYNDNIFFTSVTPGTTATNIWDDVNSGTPVDAQPIEVARDIMLAGVAMNKRIVYGSQADKEGCPYGYIEDTWEANDAYYLKIADYAREGIVKYTID